jgi:hypothetical protein
MNNHPSPQCSTMFTLRIWQEAVAEGQPEWRGRLQRLPDGDVHYFRSWPALLAHLEEELAGSVQEPTQSDRP